MVATTPVRGRAFLCWIGAAAEPGASAIPILDGRSLALLAVVLAAFGALLLRR